MTGRFEYKDIAPYYDKAEIFMGVCGAKENHPDLPDSDHFLPPVAFKCSDVAIKKAAEKAGMRAIRVRRAMLTKAHNGYGQCHYCSGCENGCETHSFYNSAFRQVVPLMKKYPKTFTLIPNAMAHKINLNAKGLASGVSFIDKTTGKDREVKARRAVVVACGTLESTRLLLMSNIANSSGMIGKNFIEHLDVRRAGLFPRTFFQGPRSGRRHRRLSHRHSLVRLFPPGREARFRCAASRSSLRHASECGLTKVAQKRSPASAANSKKRCANGRARASSWLRTARCCPARRNSSNSILR